MYPRSAWQSNYYGREDKQSPIFEVSYSILAGEGSEIVDLSIPLFIEGKQEFVRDEVTGDSIELRLPNVDLRLEYPSATSLELVGDTDPRKQDFVIANFSQVDGLIVASVKVTILSPNSSGQELFYTSFFDVDRENKIEYILSYATSDGINPFQDLLGPIPILEIHSSFNQVMLSLQGTTYLEAPYQVEVISEETTGNLRTITYKTSGLIIKKDIEVSSSTLSFSYDITPWKEDITLESMTLVLWIPYAAILQDYKIEGNKIIAFLGPGINSTKVIIDPLDGVLGSVIVGEHPEFLQQFIEIQFLLNGERGKITLNLEFDGRIDSIYSLSTRPNMDGEDTQLILTLNSFLDLKFTDERFTLYRVLAE